MSRGVAPPRLEQAVPAAGDPVAADSAAPARKRRAKAVPEAAAPVVSEQAAAPESVSAEAMERTATPDVPAVEELDMGGKRKRKPAPEENTEQQLLF